MSKLRPTYVHDQGTVYAFFEERIIAEGKDFKKVEETALDYLDGLDKQRKAKALEAEQKSATHITTPNGLKGEILGRVDGVWGDKEYTVRFENGRIAKLVAHGESEITYSNERVASTAATPVEALQEKLDADFEHDKLSLAARLKDLGSIIVEASSLIKSASFEDERQLHKIVLLAENEKAEVTDALTYLEQADAEAFTSSAPEFAHHAVEQGELGGAAANSWLDDTVQAMIDEAEGQNFDKILAEEPAQLTAGLETGTLADQGSTASIARDYIVAKTAAFMGDEVEAYREQFVAAVEQARRAELTDRAETTRKQAQAQEEESVDVPDSALFM